MTRSAFDAAPDPSPLRQAWVAYVHARGDKNTHTELLEAAGFGPAMLSDSGLATHALARNFRRLYSWTSGIGRDDSPAQWDTAVALAQAPMSLLTAWAWALTSAQHAHTTVNYPALNDPPGPGPDMIVAYRHVPLGWLYLAAGIPASEAPDIPADITTMMASLRHPWIPTISPARQGSLVVVNAPVRLPQTTP